MQSRPTHSEARPCRGLPTERPAQHTALNAPLSLPAPKQNARRAAAAHPDMLTSKGKVTVLLLTTGGMWWRLSLTWRTTAVTRPSTADCSRAWRTAAAAGAGARVGGCVECGGASKGGSRWVHGVCMCDAGGGECMLRCIACAHKRA